MAGAALGQFGTAAMGLVGLVGVVRVWAARRKSRRLGDAAPKADPEPRVDSRIEMERRMAAYLASRENYK